VGTPTHGPGCETLFSRPARCQTCDRIVRFWGCSCGSRVIFEATEKPWSKHCCSDAGNPKPRPREPGKTGHSSADSPTDVRFISTYTYGVLSTVCLRCGKSVRKREMEAHNYWTHGIGKKPGPDRRPRSTSGGTPRRAGTVTKRVGRVGAKPMVACSGCGAKVLQKNLQKHVSKRCPKSKR
jgi:DNA-directed RNA polymerase subunit RPC12/RpoP